MRKLTKVASVASIAAATVVMAPAAQATNYVTATVSVKPTVRCGPTNDSMTITASKAGAITVYGSAYGYAEGPANQRVYTTQVRRGYRVPYGNRTYTGGTMNDTFIIIQTDKATRCPVKSERIMLQKDTGVKRLTAAQATVWNRVMKDGQWAYREDVRTQYDTTKTGKILSAPLWGIFKNSTVNVSIPLSATGKPLTGSARDAAIAKAIGGSGLKLGAYKSAKAGQMVTAYLEVEARDWNTGRANSVKSGAQRASVYTVR